jgi:uncharacterized protein YecE (DUF72 family)
MRVLVGTSGYSYKAWKGNFYPAELKDADMLRFYAEQLPTVEINNTFYRMPTLPLLSHWAEVVPDGFTFVLKASQRITHRKRLLDVGGDVSYFFETAAHLGPKLGPVLFQLPPFLKKDVPRLQDFLAQVPAGRPLALEFRHPSWFEDSVYEALRAAGAALCAADTDELGEALPPLLPTASWGYLRLRRTAYDAAGLEAWADRIRAQPWERAFVFFKHEEAGAGPALAKELRAHFPS